MLHALDLATGAERPGWPVRIYDDPQNELVWDALADIQGSIYVGTGSFCDRPMDRQVDPRQASLTGGCRRFLPVPKALGGGGSIWGFGGPAYSARQDSIFVVIPPHSREERTPGPPSTSPAGYGEHLVQLSRDLDVVAANHPTTVTGTDDVDFAGSPVIFTPAGCDEVVAAVNKNGRLFLWHAASIADGPFADVPVQQASVERPLITQPAYDSATRSVYVTTFTALVRVSLTTDCDSAEVTWKEAFPNATLQGSPDGRVSDRMGCAVGRTGALARVRRADRTARVQPAVRRHVVRSTEHAGGTALRGGASRLCSRRSGCVGSRCGCRAPRVI